MRKKKTALNSWPKYSITEIIIIMYHYYHSITTVYMNLVQQKGVMYFIFSSKILCSCSFPELCSCRCSLWVVLVLIYLYTETLRHLQIQSNYILGCITRKSFKECATTSHIYEQFFYAMYVTGMHTCQFLL